MKGKAGGDIRGSGNLGVSIMLQPLVDFVNAPPKNSGGAWLRD
jgi:hypothetical protein